MPHARVTGLVAEDETLNVSFVVSDIVHLDLSRQYRLAITPDWGFQMLLAQHDQISFLKGLHRALVAGGACALDLFIPFNRQRGLVSTESGYEWRPNPTYHNNAPRTYDPVTQIETLVESNVHPIVLRHTTLSELELLFQITGCEIVEVYGDVDRRPFSGAMSEDYTIIAESR